MNHGEVSWTWTSSRRNSCMAPYRSCGRIAASVRWDLETGPVLATLLAGQVDCPTAFHIVQRMREEVSISLENQPV